MKYKLLGRDIIKPEIRLLILTIILSVFCISSILSFTEAVRAGLEDNSGILLGGDRLLSSPTPIDAAIIQKANQLGLKHSYNVTFYSMLVKQENNKEPASITSNNGNIENRGNKSEVSPGEAETFSLAEVKAVDDYYPLKGELRTSTKLYDTDEIETTAPAVGTIWLEANLFSLLNLELGDTIILGFLPLKVTKILTFEPDRGGEGLNLAAHALINLNDLEKTQVINEGSRQNYKLLMISSKPDKSDLQEFENWLLPKLSSAQKWLTAKETRTAIKTFLDQMEDYLAIIILINLLIAVIAISQTARRFAWQQYQFVALLRCFGASFSWLAGYFLLRIMFYALIATAIGYILGFGLFYLAQPFFADLLVQNIAVNWQKPMLWSFVVGILLTLLFLLPALFKLKGVSPLWIFRQRKGRIDTGLANTISPWQRKIAKWSRKFGVEIRYGIGNLLKYPFENSIQILAFALVLAAAWLVFLLRTDLIQTWEKQIPNDAPNYFIVNIFPDSVKNLQAFLEKENIHFERLYPIVRGRLMTINNEPLETGDTYTRGKTQLRRLLNLTYTMNLPSDNKILKGEWFSKQDLGQDVISVEQGFAERFQLHINDSLKFNIEGKERLVKIKSIRKVLWDSLHPNFFVIFPEQVLNEQQATYMTSFYVPPDKRFILRDLLRSFPEINLIDINLILKNVANVITKISFALNFLWLLTGAMAFLLLFCTILVSLDERRNNAILFRALGVQRKKLWTILLSEFLIVGAVAGIIGISLALVFYSYIASNIFNLPIHIQYWTLLIGPILAMIFLSIGSYLGLRSIFNVSPAKALASR